MVKMVLLVLKEILEYKDRKVIEEIKEKMEMTEKMVQVTKTQLSQMITYT
jgi:hypothetical protein